MSIFFCSLTDRHKKAFWV